MAWRRPDDKPLSEPMMVSLLTHIYVTRPQWVNCHPGNCHYQRGKFDRWGLTLQWRHYGRDGVSNHLPRYCLLSRLFRRRSKKATTSGDRWIPRANGQYAENVSIWWRHHEGLGLGKTLAKLLIDDNIMKFFFFFIWSVNCCLANNRQLMIKKISFWTKFQKP